MFFANKIVRTSEKYPSFLGTLSFALSLSLLSRLSSWLETFRRAFSKCMQFPFIGFTWLSDTIAHITAHNINTYK